VAGGRVIKSSAINKAIAKELRTLEGTPFKSITRVYERQGKVYVDAIKEVNKLEQTVTYVGNLKKTEKGFVFVPEGTGVSSVMGIIEPKIFGKSLDKQFILGATEFEAGAKGKNIFLGDVGKVRVFEEVGLTTIKPTKSIFGIVEAPKTVKELREASKLLRKQLRQGRVLEGTIKDISAPIGQRNILFQIDKRLGLRVSPQEMGVIVKAKEARTDKLIGFKGKGKKSSAEFFEELYSKPKSEVSQITKMDEILETGLIDLGKVSEVTTKAIVEAPKSISGLPIGRSLFAGTGLYERTEVTGITPKLLDIPTQPLLLDLKPETKTKVLTQIKQPKIKLFEEGILKIDTKQELREIQTLKEREILKEQFKERQRQQEIQKLASLTGTQQRITQKQKTEIKTPLIKMTPTPSISAPSIVQTGGDYDIFIKKKGKFKDVGDAQTAEEGFKKLKKGLLEDLSASGYVQNKRTGQKVSAKQFVNEMFRLSKQQKLRPHTIVQKKSGRAGGRLATSGERKAIQRAPKRQKPIRRSNNLNLFGSNSKSGNKKKKLDWFS
jgi:hypothetical protein